MTYLLDAGMTGMLSGLSGSEPKRTSRPSAYPSPSVSGFRGSVPAAISWALVRPSVSGSAVGLLPGMLIVLNAVTVGRKPTFGIVLYGPATLVPINV